MWECDRCGKCCIEFTHQIKFQNNEPLLELFKISPKLQQNPLLTLFFRIKNNFKQVIDGKEHYFIPTKSGLLPFLNENEKKLFENSNNSELNNNECMFLSWKTENNRKISFCQIHQNSPLMCKQYPSSKGGVCLNHPERYYTMEFFNYQKKKIGFAIEVLRKIYGDKVKFQIGFEIICFLMDFGRFSYEKVRNFFISNFQISSSDFTSAVQEFVKLSLIFNVNNELESISIKETERVVDDLINKYGW
ncbi:YkgJ family cysteine cluster protein [Promethearchaeum syntrophicum]|uniref:YkgJ family cysteine cluster protein n=1 Tax=Promethearchaeum syntrophicum TaxID=2594042 RepID=A0A5B9DEL0_9ARCH|nr:YkgJ family cysteine cluster protein [Candidatus Prometheoarchaeum syntrophicum]QEE17678.1 Flagellin N-methylase [Candidatus Prometheoarchaeum syntrophicum]